MATSKKNSDLLAALRFPSKGQMLSGVEVLDSKGSEEGGLFKYEIQLPKGVRQRKVPKLLQHFFNNQLLNLKDGDHIVSAHDYSVRAKNGRTHVIGSMQITPIVLANPGAEALTKMQEFDQDYSKMAKSSPDESSPHRFPS